MCIRDSIKCGLITDGTAVGMGIANAVTLLKDSKAKSKVIILLTDGTNNKGPVDQQHFLSGLRQPNPQVRAGGCLANAAFLVGDGDNLRVQ